MFYFDKQLVINLDEIQVVYREDERTLFVRFAGKKEGERFTFDTSRECDVFLEGISDLLIRKNNENNTR